MTIRKTRILPPSSLIFVSIYASACFLVIGNAVHNLPLNGVMSCNQIATLPAIVFIMKNTLQT